MNLKEFLLAEISKSEVAAASAESDGTAWWYQVPIPPRRHKCWTQTEGVTGSLTHVRRCGCGAVQLDNDGVWFERNSRRKESTGG